MAYRIDLKGKRFGRLTVIKFHSLKSYGNQGHKQHHARWTCVCDCGVKKIVSARHLTGGAIKSCGCLCLELAAERKTTHGISRSRIYCIWNTMWQRCYSKKCISYPNYGGRGIKICKSWEDPVAFYKWARSHGYKKNLSIDRINNDKGYSPANCRWATNKQQANNKRNSKSKK